MADIIEQLIIDLSDEHISVSTGNDSYLSDIKSDNFWDNYDEALVSIREFLTLKDIIKIKSVIFTLPVSQLAYQVITLPDNISERESKVLLKLELDELKFTNRFNFLRLDVTKRIEMDDEVCDYIVIAPKKSAQKALETFAKDLSTKIAKIVPAFFLVTPATTGSLTATAWVSDKKSEIVIWGNDNPLTLATINNTGDPMGDINRFIKEYFDHVEGLDLSLIRLYGPKMTDSSLGFSLNYPNEILDEPRTLTARLLYKASEILDFGKHTSLPRPPIEMNTRNIIIAAALCITTLLMVVGAFKKTSNAMLSSRIQQLEAKSSTNTKLLAQAKKLEAEQKTLEQEKEFYLSITKRRTPWHAILSNLSDLTPRNLWIERLNSTTRHMTIAGKAIDSDQVSALSINLNQNSRYFQEAQIQRTRDYEEENKTFNEFQISTKLKSPTNRYH